MERLVACLRGKANRTGLLYVVLTRVKHPWNLFFHPGLPDLHEILPTRDDPDFLDRLRFEWEARIMGARTLRKATWSGCWTPADNEIADQVVDFWLENADRQQWRLPDELDRLVSQIRTIPRNVVKQIFDRLVATDEGLLRSPPPRHGGDCQIFRKGDVTNGTTAENDLNTGQRQSPNEHPKQPVPGFPSRGSDELSPTNEDDAALLESMVFQPQKVKTALRHSGGDIELAIDELLTNDDEARAGESKSANNLVGRSQDSHSATERNKSNELVLFLAMGFGEKMALRALDHAGKNFGTALEILLYGGEDVNQASRLAVKHSMAKRRQAVKSLRPPAQNRGAHAEWLARAQDHLGVSFRVCDIGIQAGPWSNGCLWLSVAAAWSRIPNEHPALAASDLVANTLELRTTVAQTPETHLQKQRRRTGQDPIGQLADIL